MKLPGVLCRLVVVALLVSIQAAGRGTACVWADEPRWTRVIGPHFVVSGDVRAEDAREVAILLEMFRDVFLRVLPGARDRSMLPPFVVVFGSDRAFTPYKPTFDGKPAPVAGYTVHEPLTPLTALRLDDSRDAFRTVFHEYAHVLYDTPQAPFWVSEGVADYYSTATVSRDRQRVQLGGRIPAHLARLSRRWIPLAQVLAASRGGRPPGDVEMIYAESWALVHYLTRGTAAHGAQVLRFLERVASGARELPAFEETIGPVERVEAELRRYLRAGMSPPEEVTLPAPAGLQPLRERSMTQAEVDATVGRVLYHLQRDDEALQRIRSALALEPTLKEALTTLGLLRLRQHQPAEALEPFRAVNLAEPTNTLVAYDFALVALQVHDAGGSAPLDEGRAALERVVRADGPAEALAVLGTILGRLGRLDEAESRLRRAAELAPSRFPTQLEVAETCFRRGGFDEAREILRRLSAGATVDQLDMIAQRSRWLTLAEERSSLRAELAAAAGLAAGPDPGVAQTGRFPMPPTLRPVRTGEQRVAGLLDGIDCTSVGVSARLTTASGTRTFTARSLDEVYLASARSDVSGALSCGVREGREAVYATGTADRRLVAIEFLPAEFQPRR
jgi:tetratricopeptide (TPR) repeat protein